MDRDPQDPSRRPGLKYSDAGVDIDAQDQALARIKELVRSTRTPGVLTGSHEAPCTAPAKGSAPA